MAYRFLFDLDMTLIDSSNLAPLRRQGKWKEALSNLDRARAFPMSPAPHEVVQRLNAMGHLIGVVTNSPSDYAKAVLERFQVPFDVLVAYHDTNEHKPHPAPLMLALERLGRMYSSNDEKAFHVGDQADDVEASHRADVVSVGAGWGMTSLDALTATAPDILLAQPAPLLRPSKLLAHGYTAEAFLAGLDVSPHPCSALPCGDGKYALGRYYVVSDARHASSRLSQDVLTFKLSDDPAPQFARALGEFINTLPWAEPFYVVAVPPKPGQSRDRFVSLFNALEPLLDKTRTRIVRDGLRCERAVEGYKQMRRYERREAIEGVFSTEYDWKKARVLLVDDVLTTGSTVEECEAVLLKSGASEVRVVTFAHDQDNLSVAKTCPLCGLSMKVKTNGTDQSRFWGCSGYGVTGCRYTENV